MDHSLLRGLAGVLGGSANPLVDVIQVIEPVGHAGGEAWSLLDLNQPFQG